MIRTTIDGMEYGGSANNYYWDRSINPYATVENGLPNCTTGAFGLVIESGLPTPISKASDAGSWHNYVTNGWIAKPYLEYKDNLKVGDIIEWSNNNHVAVVSSVLSGVKVSASFYTGIHGKAYYGKDYDTREGINSLKELNDYFYDKYQYRFFHYATLEEECKWCNGNPDYVLIAPSTITPIPKDTNKNQVYIGTNGLRIRTEANIQSTIKGIANVGYYNAEKTEGGKWEDRGNEGTTWYKVENYYMAGVDGVSYYPAESIDDPIREIEELFRQLTAQVDVLKDENARLKAKLKKIEEVLNE